MQQQWKKNCQPKITKRAVSSKKSMPIFSYIYLNLYHQIRVIFLYHQNCMCTFSMGHDHQKLLEFVFLCKHKITTTTIFYTLILLSQNCYLKTKNIFDVFFFNFFSIRWANSTQKNHSEIGKGIFLPGFRLMSFRVFRKKSLLKIWFFWGRLVYITDNLWFIQKKNQNEFPFFFEKNTTIVDNFEI